MTTRFPFVRRATTFCGSAQLKSEGRDSPPAANPDSFTNSRRLSFIRSPSYLALDFPGNLLRQILKARLDGDRRVLDVVRGIRTDDASRSH